ncbi:MAG: hypothetical protein GKR91_01955 [Pseudomonadales bacterium]|nr:hypothetical protein [Pseudomonadales bacterium]
MNQGTKQRIVGTVVLLALALIFLPIIFDGQGSYQTQLSSRVPAEPIIPILPEPTQDRPVIVADSIEADPEESAEAAIPEETNEDTVQVTTSEPAFTREIPQLDAAGLPQGWSVRLGSFAQEENANNLMDRLQASGYKAYTRNIRNTQGSLTSVFVGPWLDRNLVDQYKEELQDQFRLAGDIVRFEIEQL